ncbi:hypothetical protein ACQWU4_17990 [Chryseobacterium sp. MIQD13]|uniref:hypothetical protein n=1 Tax=Chryseobacterium sp. MIQD13 TaxID=3422310 RepID=UPI003D279EC3
MKNRLFTIAAMSLCFGVSAQVGINIGQGQATLDVVGFPSNTSKMDGIIAPRLTETDLNKKTYGAAQTGALVYVTLADIAPAGQTVNVTAPGYYYFDGTVWVKVSSGSSAGTVTGFSSGNLSPLFTTTVTNPTTNPALAFALTNAPANTIFGNNTASAGAPSYFSASTLPLNGDVTGTLGTTTVVKINGSPLGTTTGATNGQVLAFNGTNWSPLTLAAQPTDWHITGNIAGEISTTTEVLGAAPASANYLGPKGAADLVMISANKVHAVLDAGGGLSGGGENASSLSWGSTNTVNSTSNNIALGKGNTATTSGANFPAVAIGSNNNVAGGGKAVGNNNSTLSNANFAFGAFNTTGNSIAVAVGHTNNATNGGFAFGANNTVTLNNFAFGSNNNVSGTAGSIAIGVGGTSVANQSTYANTTHVFSGQGAVGSVISDVGINMTPNLTNYADLEVSKAVQIKSTATRPTCDASNAGSIIYEVTTVLSVTSGNFVGCRQTGNSAYAWQTL